MAGLRHPRKGNIRPDNNSSQRTVLGSTNSANILPQRSDVNSTHSTSEKHRGTRKRAIVQLRIPPRGRKVGLEPQGDRQFKYTAYHSRDYKYTTQLGVLLKREYLGKIEERDGDGFITNTRPALEWYDYYHDGTIDFQQRTAADRVKEEFWNLFELHVNDGEDESARVQVEEEANRVIDNYARKKVKDMLYQLRVDAVKLYYEKQGEELDDSMARGRELDYGQYLQSRIPWCKEDAWPELCRYWTSKPYKTSRARGQESRLKSEDVAQNRGGSRPFTGTQQYLAEKFGPEEATTLNTYVAMKCGMKNVSSSGNNTSTISRKAQTHSDTYSSLAKEKYPDDWEERELDGEILYEASGGIPHGRVSIADGAIKKSAIIPSARKKNARATLSLTLREKEQLRRANEENAQLRRTNEMLQQKTEMHGQLIIALFKEIGKEVPADMLSQLLGVQQGTTNSSQVGSQAVDGNTDGGDSTDDNDANNSNGNMGDDGSDTANLSANGGTNGSNNFTA